MVGDGDGDGDEHSLAHAAGNLVRVLLKPAFGVVGLAELRHLADELERTARDKLPIEFSAIDLQFHLKLLAYGNNKSLVDTVRGLRLRSRLYGIPQLADRGELASTAHEHTELLDLICSGDADGAEALMRRHIRHVRGVWATGDSTDE
ncbi:FCD domain-containing protein [Nonomuraea sp. KC401]|nr:FCD domain-containing protein [Nonomuraea sp. KC401]